MKKGDLIELELGWLSNGHREVILAIVTGIDTSDPYECEVMFYRHGKQRYTWIQYDYAENRRIK